MFRPFLHRPDTKPSATRLAGGVALVLAGGVVATGLLWLRLGPSGRGSAGPRSATAGVAVAEADRNADVGSARSSSDRGPGAEPVAARRGGTRPVATERRAGPPMATITATVATARAASRMSMSCSRRGIDWSGGSPRRWRGPASPSWHWNTPRRMHRPARGGWPPAW